MNPKSLGDPAGAGGTGKPHFEALLEAAGDAAWIKDPNLRYLAVNSGFGRLFRREPRAVIGRTDTEIFDAERAARHEKEDWFAIDGNTAPATLDEVRDASGQTRQIAVIRRPVRDASGILLGVLGIARDVTEQRDLEQRLIHSQKMEAVGRLAGGVAHDFNNLLTAIQGYSALLLTELPSGNPHREYVEEILKAGERATSLTRQLLAFSRRQVLEPRVLDLNEVVRGVSRMLSRVIGENIELAINENPNLWHVFADPGQLEQVIMNLAVNARDAMPRGGKLMLETQNVQLDGSQWQKDLPVSAGDYALLAVSDTGIGIAPDIRSRLFEPFFTTKPRGEGTGLGLSTVYGIVKQSGGYVWVYSEPGNGSVFKIYLPRVDAPLPSVDRPRASAAAAAARGSEAILLVEDESEVRTLMEKLLRLQGYSVIGAAEPAAAIRAAATHEGPIHLLVTDVMLPGLTGRDVAQQIQRLRPGIPVLFVSGYSDEAVVRDGALEPGTHFLQKPFTPSMLGKKIREILDGK